MSVDIIYMYPKGLIKSILNNSRLSLLLDTVVVNLMEFFPLPSGLLQEISSVKNKGLCYKLHYGHMNSPQPSFQLVI